MSLRSSRAAAAVRVGAGVAGRRISRAGRATSVRVSGASASAASGGFGAATFGRYTAAYQDISTTNDPGGRLVQLVLRFNF